MRGKKFIRLIVGILAITTASLVLGSSAWAQAKFKMLHKFTGPAHGRTPNAGLTFDTAGSLYGTTHGGGTNHNHGSVFKLTPNADGTWTESVIHSFSGTPDGYWPSAALIFDTAGNLYGTTYRGGVWDSGTVFELVPNSDGTWTENILYSLLGWYWKDGQFPQAGLIFDGAGNLYGTASTGGLCNQGYDCYGVVFERTHNPDGSWTESLPHEFYRDGLDGVYPSDALIFDAVGNLYGTTYSGGTYFWYGTVFKMKPNGDGTWTESVLYGFTGGNDGANPYAGLVFDAAGSLYGTASQGGAYGGGVVFKLTPNRNGTWRQRVLHQFAGKEGSAPVAGLIFDPAGNLYGTAAGGGAYGYGVVFRMQHKPIGGWSYRVLHSFRNATDGAYPGAGLILDEAGNLYGTTEGDSKQTFGTVFQITP